VIENQGLAWKAVLNGAILRIRPRRKARDKNFVAIACLNDSAPGMLVIWQMALRELKGWV
jgi:hypothetical protein